MYFYTAAYLIIGIMGCRRAFSPKFKLTLYPLLDLLYILRRTSNSGLLIAPARHLPFPCIQLFVYMLIAFQTMGTSRHAVLMHMSGAHE